jgi:hypothetical protein
MTRLGDSFQISNADLVRDDNKKGNNEESVEGGEATAS